MSNNCKMYSDFCNSNPDNYNRDKEGKNKEFNEELYNLLVALVKSLNENSTAISQLLIQNNDQQVSTNDVSRFSNIGGNDVNVVNYIDPDTISSAAAYNDNDNINGAISASASLSAAISLILDNILAQIGASNEA